MSYEITNDINQGSIMTKQEYINSLEALLNHPETNKWVKKSYRNTLQLILLSLKKNEIREQMENMRLEKQAMRAFQLDDGSTVIKEKTSLGIEYTYTKGE